MMFTTRVKLFSILSLLFLAGCQTGGSSMEVELQEDATPLTTGELYTYFAEQTQERENGGIYYTEFGTLISLEDGERFEGTWGSYDGGKLCHHYDDREDGPCEIYYNQGGAVVVAIGDKAMVAPKLYAGNQLDLLDTGSARKMYTREETIELVSGKTHQWENYNGAYYQPDGKLFTVWDGVKESGKWSVNDDGQLCWHIPSWGNGPCEGYFMGADGLMSVYKGKEAAADPLLDGNQLNNL